MARLPHTVLRTALRFISWEDPSNRRFWEEMRIQTAVVGERYCNAVL